MQGHVNDAMYNTKWEPATLHFDLCPRGGTVLKAFIDEPVLADELWFGERDLLSQILYWLTAEPFTAFFIVPYENNSRNTEVFATK